jgi:hypothetical protein
VTYLVQTPILGGTRPLIGVSAHRTAA